jgi:hypothetical protein
MLFGRLDEPCRLRQHYSPLVMALSSVHVSVDALATLAGTQGLLSGHIGCPSLLV